MSRTYPLKSQREARIDGVATEKGYRLEKVGRFPPRYRLVLRRTGRCPFAGSWSAGKVEMFLMAFGAEIFK